MAGRAANTLSVASYEKRPCDRGSALTTPLLAKSGASFTARCPARPTDTTVSERTISLWKRDGVTVNL